MADKVESVTVESALSTIVNQMARHIVEGLEPKMREVVREELAATRGNGAAAEETPSKKAPAKKKKAKRKTKRAKTDSRDRDQLLMQARGKLRSLYEESDEVAEKFFNGLGVETISELDDDALRAAMAAAELKITALKTDKAATEEEEAGEPDFLKS